MRVAIVSVGGQPLSPTTPAKARKLIKDKIAVPKRNDMGIFYLQLTRSVGTKVPHKTVIGNDPGKLYSGIGVQTPKATLWMGHLNLPFKAVKKAMKARRNLRRGRRYRKTPCRECRFLHRTGHKLPPSIKSNRQLELRIIQELCKIFPVTDIVYEIVKAKGNKSFSPVMVGQNWMVKQLSKLAQTHTLFGYETSAIRKYLRLSKDNHKSNPNPATHAVDGIALAASELINYKRLTTKNSEGYIWVGECIITESPFAIIQRPQLFRRKLHVENPAKGGMRKRHGGTTTPYGFRKGDYVEAIKANNIVRGYISGYSESNNVLSIADHAWKRIGQFAVSKVRLLRRATGILVDSKNAVTII